MHQLKEGKMPLYRKKVLQEMRPYTPGENMEGVSIENGVVPIEGGMIAQNPDNPLDIWYISPEFMKANYEAVNESKTMGNTDQSGCQDNVPDVVFFGPDLFKLLSKASSEIEDWMKSTKAMQVSNGCLVQVSTQQGEHVAEAITFVPGVKIREITDDNGDITGRTLMRI